MLYAFRWPLQLTRVLTESMAAAEGSISSTKAMQASLYGIDTPQPRIPKARIPATAAGRSSVRIAL
ncbi:hypothetical protein D9M68_985340 [compost metagenome]